MANPLQIRRGNKTNLPILASGEPGFAVDEQEVFIGTGTANIRLLTTDDFHTQGTDPGLDAGGANPVTAAELVTLRDTTVPAKADKINVLELDNTTVFTPDADYEPATKKYVDDNAGGTVSDTAYDESTWNNNTDAATKNAIRDKFESLQGTTPFSVAIPDWPVTLTYNATGDLATATYASGTERYRQTLTYTAGVLTSVLYEHSTDSGGTYAELGTETLVYTSGDLTSTTWTAA